MWKYRRISFSNIMKAKRTTLQWQSFNGRSPSPTIFGRFASQKRFVRGFLQELLQWQNCRRWISTAARQQLLDGACEHWNSTWILSWILHWILSPLHWILLTYSIRLILVGIKWNVHPVPTWGRQNWLYPPRGIHIHVLLTTPQSESYTHPLNDFSIISLKFGGKSEKFLRF